MILLAALAAPGALSQTRSRRPRSAKPHTARSADVEKDLRELESQWLGAYARRDAEALQRIEADDFTITYPDGKVLTRNDEIEKIKKEAGTARDGTAAHTEDTKVRLFGDVAILTGRYLVTRGEGGPTISESRYTDVYAKRQGRWQVVASQLTGIPRKENAAAAEASMGKEVITPSGLKYVDEVIGTRDSLKPGQTVTVHYAGTLEDGTEFDSSYKRGQPFKFRIGLGQVIKDGTRACSR